MPWHCQFNIDQNKFATHVALCGDTQKLGVKPPEKRKDGDRGQYYKEYEEKRARAFNTKSTVDHPWLKDSNEGMQCTLCFKFDKSGSNFTKGCTSYKLDSVQKHEKSKVHQRSIEISTGLEKPVKESDAAKIITCLTAEAYEKLISVFFGLIHCGLVDFLMGP